MSGVIFKSIKNTIITLLILGVLGLGFFLVLFGDSVMDQIRDEIIGRIEENIPYQVNWERMAIFPINNLVIEGIEVSTLEEEEPFFLAERVVVGYSFWELILGRISPAASIKRISIEDFQIWAEDPMAFLPEFEEEVFRSRIQLSEGRGLVGWEGQGEEIKNISGDFWPVGENGWEGKLQFSLLEGPGKPIYLSGFWQPGELDGTINISDFPISVAGKYLPDDRFVIRDGLLSGELSVDYREGEDLNYNGRFRLSSGKAWVATIEEELKDLSGEMEFSPEKVLVKEGNAFLEGMELKFSGDYLFAKEEFDLVLDFESLELKRAQELLYKLGFWDPDFPDIAGEGKLSLKTRGDFNDSQGQADFLFSEAKVGQLSFSGLGGTATYQGEIRGQNANVESNFSITQALFEDAIITGMEGSVVYQGDFWGQNPTVASNFSVEQGRIEEMGFNGLEGILSFKGESFVKAPLVQLDFSLDQGTAEGLEISGFEGTFYFEDEFWGQDPFAQLSFSISSGIADQIEFSGLQGFISFQDELFSFRELQGELAGGRFSMNGQVGSEVLLFIDFAELNPSYWPEEYPWPEGVNRQGDLGGKLLISGPTDSLEKLNFAGDIRWENPVLAEIQLQEIESIFWVNGQKILFDPMIITDKAGGIIEIQGTSDFALEEFDFQLWASGIKLENYPLGEGISGELDFDGRVKGSMENPEFMGSFSGRDLAWEEEKLGNVEGKIELREDKIIFDRVNVFHPWGQVEVSGGIDTSGDTPHTYLFVEAVGPCLSPVIEELGIPIEIFGEVKLSVELEGSFSEPIARGKIELSQGTIGDQPFDFLRADLNWEEEKLYFPDFEVNVAGGLLRGRGSFSFPDQIEIVLEGEQLALEEFEEWESYFPQFLGKLSFSIEADGSWPDIVAKGLLKVERVVFAGEYLGDIEGNFSYEGGWLDLKNVVLFGQEGLYSIEGRAQVAPPGEIDLRLTTEEASLERLLAVAGLDEFWFPVIPVTLAGEAKLNGTFERPRIDVSGSAFYPAGELEITGGGFLDGPYEAVIQGSIDIDLISEFLPEHFDIRGRGEVEVYIQYDEEWNVSGENILHELAFNGVTFSRVEGIFSWQDNQPFFVEQRLISPEGEYLEISGLVPLEPDREDLDLKVYTESFDLGFLANFNPFVLSLEGKGLIDSKIKGSINKPLVEGEGYVEGGSFQYFNMPGRVEEIRVGVKFSGNEMIMENVRGKYSEGGDLALTGKIVFSGWEPDYYDLLLTAEELHINHGTINGYGNGEMTITGSYWEPHLVGYMNVFDTVIGIPFDWPYQEREEEPRVEPHFELAFRHGGNIRVRNGNFDVQVQSGEVVMDNRTGEMELIGEAVSRQGNINFYNTNFRLIEGRARFLRFGESIPNINAVAQTTIRGTQVSVHLDGPALDMDMRLTSQPQLEEQEIMDLLIYRGGLGELLRGDLPGAFRQELWRIIGETFRTSFLMELQTRVGDLLELDEFLITPILLGQEERIEFYLGKAITDRIYITYTQDFWIDGSKREFGIEYRLRDNLFFSGSLRDEGNFQLGIEFNYPF